MLFQLFVPLVVCVVSGCATQGPPSVAEKVAVERETATLVAEHVKSFAIGGTNEFKPDSTLVRAVKHVEKKEPENSKLYAGPVRLTLTIFCIYSGDGPEPPINSAGTEFNDIQWGEEAGDVFTLFYVSGEEALQRVWTEDCVSLKPSSFQPLKTKEFIVYPSKDPFHIKVVVIDEDRIGDQKAAEIRNFVSNLGAAAGNLYPPSAIAVPIFQELFGMICIDLPNIFLGNETLAVIDIPIHRTSQGVTLESRAKPESHCFYTLVSTPMPVPVPQ